MKQLLPIMFMMMVLNAFILSSNSVVYASSRSELTSLPLLQGKFSEKQYTGFVDIPSSTQPQKKLFYWFVTAKKDPLRSPVVLWMTGGPGCSGLLAYMTEHGPYQLNQAGNMLIENPYSWNQQANIIYLEQPYGVGYSTANPVNSTSYPSGDKESARDNLSFIVTFLFELFPEYSKNAFFVSGESYGGNYVPLLVREILKYNANQPSKKIALKGLSVGNPTMDGNLDANGYFPFMYNHALVGSEEFLQYQKECPNFLTPSQKCQDIINTMRNNIGPINPYNIYAKCLGKPSIGGACFTHQMVYSSQLKKKVPRRVMDSQTYIPCINVTTTTNYFNRRDVQLAIHAIGASENTKEWDVCSPYLQYNDIVDSMIPVYQEIYQLNPSLLTLIYSGDVDSCCPYPSTELAVMKFGFSISIPYHPYFLDNQVVGYIKGYNTEKNIFFATVKNAGHMVPTYQPEVALKLFNAFLTCSLSSL
ncbi:hypothetical protein FDP41_004842 [Naegleria fowleri]|uniref:Carboxypeptidase n=1 Tax=Naegleria fowleri TaxID=5763 RepID=A0A6A5BGZ3_NAEFO|nr:uncharacterized protein FDP41_004842 [Naegleria fowleri]KAF0976167.1 hypothetical protein FDP41_004842 [Naegleria fowleri]